MCLSEVTICCTLLYPLVDVTCPQASFDLAHFGSIHSADDVCQLPILRTPRNMTEKNALYWKNAGNEAFEKGEFQAAVNHYTRSIAMEANDAILYSNRSIALAKMSFFEQAVKDANKAIELKPQWFKGWLRRGTALMSLGQYEEAAAALQQASSLNQKDKQIFSLVTECQMRLMTKHFMEVPTPSKPSRSVNSTDPVSDAKSYATKLHSFSRETWDTEKRLEFTNEIYMAPLRYEDDQAQTTFWKTFCATPEEPLKKLRDIAWNEKEEPHIRSYMRSLIGAAAMWFARAYTDERNTKPLPYNLVGMLTDCLRIPDPGLRYATVDEIAPILNYDVSRFGGPNSGYAHPRPPTYDQIDKMLIFTRQFVEAGAVEALLDILEWPVRNSERRSAIESALTCLGRFSFIQTVRAKLKEKKEGQNESAMEKIIRVACRDPDLQDLLEEQKSANVLSSMMNSLQSAVGAGRDHDRGLGCMTDLIVGPVQHEAYPIDMDAAKIFLVHGGAGRMVQKLCMPGMIFMRILFCARALSSIVKKLWEPENYDYAKLFAKQVSVKHLRHLLTLGLKSNTKTYRMLVTGNDPTSTEEAQLLKVHANAAMMTDIIGIFHAKKLHQILIDGTLEAITKVFVDMVNEGTLKALGTLAFRTPIALHLSKHKDFMDVLFVILENPDIENPVRLHTITLLVSNCLRCMSVMSWTPLVRKRIVNSSDFIFQRLMTFIRDNPKNSFAAQNRKYAAHMLCNIACCDHKQLAIIKRGKMVGQFMDFIVDQSKKMNFPASIIEMVNDARSTINIAKAPLSAEPKYVADWWFNENTDAYPAAEFVAHCARLACPWAAVPGEETKMWSDPKTKSKYCSEACFKLNSNDDGELQVV